MPVLLIMLSADQTRRVFRMTDSAVTIGRDVHCEIRVLLPSVAPRHARIIADDQSGVRLIDLAGTQAAEANDQPAPRPRLLTDGDVIEVGPVRFQVRIATRESDCARIRELLAESVPIGHDTTPSVDPSDGDREPV